MIWISAGALLFLTIAAYFALTANGRAFQQQAAGVLALTAIAWFFLFRAVMDQSQQPSFVLAIMLVGVGAVTFMVARLYFPDRETPADERPVRMAVSLGLGACSLVSIIIAVVTGIAVFS